MSSTNHQSAHRALLSLERSSASPTELLGEAAIILGVSFDETRDELLDTRIGVPPEIPTLFAPKEEWTLRWLLKKTKPGVKVTSSDPEAESTVNDDPRKWLLFFHLVCRTPVKRLAKILREQEALWQIEDALLQQVKVCRKNLPTSVSGGLRFGVQGYRDNSYGLPQGDSKKRKLSQVLLEPVGKDSTLLVILSILRALRVCLEYSLATNEADVVSHQHMRIALSVAPERVTTVFDHIFRIVVSILGSATIRPLCDDIFYLLYSVSRLWDLRHGPELGYTVDECNRLFATHCLMPSLSLLRFIKSTGPKRHKDLEMWLEKLVAEHVVEPARRVFFDDVASTWKPNQDPILPEHIKPVLDQLQDSLFPSGTASSFSTDLDNAISSFSFVAPILLEIAVRSCPRSTVRKVQHEQPWLEALFVYLAHIGECSLLKGEELAQKTNRERGTTSLDLLLSTAIEWKVSLSLPLLSAFAQQFAGLQQHQSTDWDVVAKIMQLDVDVFLPNSGISSAEELLDQLLKNLSAGAKDSSHKSRQLDILSMLMKGFVSARDLATFVKVWMDRIASLEDSRALQDVKGETVNSHSLWDDVDLIAEFSKIAKTSTNPRFVESHLLATLDALRDSEYRGKHYALMLVLDVFLSRHAEEIESSKDTLKLLYDEMQNAVQHMRGSDRNTGLLWRLLRHVFPLVEVEPLLLFSDLLEGKEKSIVETSMQIANKKPVSELPSVRSFSEVERFHCFIATAAIHPSATRKHLNVEISSLTHHLVKLTSGDVEPSVATKSWNGLRGSLESTFDLSVAFIGILLRNSRVLCLNTETPISLLKAMALHVKDQNAKGTKLSSALAVLLEGLLLDEWLVSTPGFVKNSVKDIGLMDEGRSSDKTMALIQALPKDAISKAQRKQIAEWQHGKEAASRKTDVNQIDSDSDLAEIERLEQDALGSAKAILTYGDLQRSWRKAGGAAAVKSREDIADLCASLRKESPSQADFLNLGSMLSKGETISPYVTGLAADLASLLPKSTSIENFCLTANCIKIILDKHHESINQWTIDSLLAALAITTSPQGPTIPDSTPIIFERLCRLLSVVLGRYRIRLGGRYHLLLPVLYGLLHCLFAQDARSLNTQSQLLFHSKLPSWIGSSTTPLSKDSATHLTRLLTSICDPTPSSVKRTHNSLNDHTKKARDTAGQYMQYFIAEYAYCQLHGRIGVEAKAGLMPGLYAVLDVMGREVMRGMNAKMDASQKAIFKGLYEDYTRFGRWNGM